eukprot:1196223-Prorocentrum_minimum.AAC.2
MLADVCTANKDFLPYNFAVFTPYLHRDNRISPYRRLACVPFAVLPAVSTAIGVSGLSACTPGSQAGGRAPRRTLSALPGPPPGWRRPAPPSSPPPPTAPPVFEE